MTTTRKLYDLAGADPDRRFSPYCWRSKLALAHKGLAVETIPWRFTEKDAIAFSGQCRVPVLVDGETTVFDSWSIATYLEDTYPDRPSLFGGAGGRACVTSQKPARGMRPKPSLKMSNAFHDSESDVTSNQGVSPPRPWPMISTYCCRAKRRASRKPRTTF